MKKLAHVVAFSALLILAFLLTLFDGIAHGGYSLGTVFSSACLYALPYLVPVVVGVLTLLFQRFSSADAHTVLLIKSIFNALSLVFTLLISAFYVYASASWQPKVLLVCAIICCAVSIIFTVREYKENKEND